MHNLQTHLHCLLYLNHYCIHNHHYHRKKTFLHMHLKIQQQFQHLKYEHLIELYYYILSFLHHLQQLRHLHHLHHLQHLQQARYIAIRDTDGAIADRVFNTERREAALTGRESLSAQWDASNPNLLTLRDGRTGSVVETKARGMMDAGFPSRESESPRVADDTHESA